MSRSILLLIVCVFLIGCVGNGVSGTASENQQTNSMSSSQSPTVTPWYGEKCRELASRDIPPVPENLTRQSVVSFAESYTNSTYWNEQFAGKQYVRADVDTTGFVVNQTETGYIVHVGRQSSSLNCEGVHSDPTQHGYGYDYFLNESLFAMNYTGTGVKNASVHPPVSADEIIRNGTVIEYLNESR